MKKKIMALISILLILVLFVSCGGTGGSGSQSQSSPSETVQQKEESNSSDNEVSKGEPSEERIKELMDWADKYITVVYDVIKPYEGKFIRDMENETGITSVMIGYADGINSNPKAKEIWETLQKYEKEKAPYPDYETMGEISDSWVDILDNKDVYYVEVHIEDVDKPIAEKMAKEKGDYYYLIGAVVVENNRSEDPENPKILKVKKVVYISSDLP